MIEYQARMVSGEVIHFLSENIENAAWDAFELAQASDDILSDVIPLFIDPLELSNDW